jgi:hypothetical protein
VFTRRQILQTGAATGPMFAGIDMGAPGKDIIVMGGSTTCDHSTPSTDNMFGLLRVWRGDERAAILVGKIETINYRACARYQEVGVNAHIWVSDSNATLSFNCVDPIPELGDLAKEIVLSRSPQLYSMSLSLYAGLVETSVRPRFRIASKRAWLQHFTDHAMAFQLYYVRQKYLGD